MIAGIFTATKTPSNCLLKDASPAQDTFVHTYRPEEWSKPTVSKQVKSQQ
jgi:hypothetical protein